MTETELTYQIRGAIFDVYNTLGPGLLESVYEEALVYELLQRGLKVERQVEVPILYKGREYDYRRVKVSRRDEASVCKTTAYISKAP